MNRLILIGNGFDLAHGLKTSYNDFIIWYLINAFSQAIEDGKYDDELLEINILNRRNRPFVLGELKDIPSFIKLFYDNEGFAALLNNPPDLKIPTKRGNTYTNPFRIKLKSELMETLLLKCRYANWVDIENEFYEQLKNILNFKAKPPGALRYNYKTKVMALQALNHALKNLIIQLKRYLETIPPSPNIKAYLNIFNSDILKGDIVTTDIEGNDKPCDTLVLNFNYTSTAEKYIKASKNNPQAIRINYIHGKLKDDNNPFIFGFGDELDEYYVKMEMEKTEGFFEYIKSFWYFKTSNYHDLIRFIEGKDFQVYVLGHSCGLSDRTMLNMIFEHQLCKSIKIFYYIDDKGTDNFKILTQEISRHFKNKGEMRKKIVPFNKSRSMPQFVS